MVYDNAGHVQRVSGQHVIGSCEGFGSVIHMNRHFEISSPVAGGIPKPPTLANAWPRLGAVMMVVLQFACNRPPTRPTIAEELAPPGVNVSGVWQGRYRETRCTSTCCQPSCSMRFKGGAPMRDFTITLTQEGALVSGLFAETPVPNVSPLKGVVSGVVSERRLKLVGSLGWRSEIFPDNFGIVDLQNFEGSVDALGERVTGTFVLRDLRMDGSEFLRRECEIVRLGRTSP